MRLLSRVTDTRFLLVFAVGAFLLGMLAIDVAAQTSAPFPLEDAFKLHSNPGAKHTIYLDFDGHTTSGTAWNSAYNGGEDIVTPPFDLNGEVSDFTDQELERIQHIWQSVAEDYFPFEVDVTTEDPGIEMLTNAGGDDETWGIRTVIGGGSYDWYTGAKGIALVGSFDISTDTPVFIFSKDVKGAEKVVAETASHEIGHTLNLNHDGTTQNTYYAGHGSSETGWAPIMGTGQWRKLTQWSKGEYPNANNDTDDLVLITTSNGFSYRTDDHGNSIATASTLISSGTTVTDYGIIERSIDVDVFSFVTDGGLVDLSIYPADRGPNLDILAELYDSNEKLLAASNPVDLLTASIQQNVSAGQYFLKISGIGKYDPDGYGYTDYGSLGQYTILGTIAPSSEKYISITANTANKNEGNSGSTNFSYTVVRAGDASGAMTVRYSTSGGGSSAAASSDFTGGSFPAGSISFGAGESSKVLSVAVAGDTIIEPDEGFEIRLSSPSDSTQITTASTSFKILNDDKEAPPPPPTASYSLSGKITLSGQALSGVTLSNSGASTQSSSAGYYSFPSIAEGRAYSIRASKTGYAFSPSRYEGTASSSQSNLNFTASCASGYELSYSRKKGYSCKQPKGTKGGGKGRK